MAGRGRGGGKKQNISFTKPEEPAFLKRIKAQVGYKEPATIEAKKQIIDQSDNAEEDEEKGLLNEETGPQIVVLKPGKDLDESQVAEVLKKKEEIEERHKIEIGDITFKKPEKKQEPEKTADEKEDKSSDSSQSSDRKRDHSDSSSSQNTKRSRSEKEDSRDYGNRRCSDSRRSPDRHKTAQKAVNETRLLSFGDDEAEDEDN